ncbi:MAG: hypothetical protein HY273_03555 [Gammaproteobacteria bacterium]|nr:hypothetical protein [Gammaproteobacteria bacterium]
MTSNLFTVSLGLAVCGTCSAQEGVIYARLNGFAYSDPLAYGEFTKDWHGRLYAGDEALQHLRAQLGVDFGEWGVELVSRDDGDARFSPDTAAFYFLLQNKQALESQRRYVIDLRINHVTTHGARAYHRYALSPYVQIDAGASVFSADKLISGTLKGALTAVSANDYDAEHVAVDYYYSRDTLFDRDVVAPTGWGYAFDVALTARTERDWQLRLELQNVLGRVNWNNAPFTKATINTDNISHDQNGNVIVKPLLSGQFGYRDFQQHLPLLGSMQTSYRVTDVIDGLGEVNATPVKSFWSYGMAYHIDFLAATLKTLYTVETGQITLGINSTWGYLSIGADRVELHNARALSIATGIAMNFIRW